MKKETFAEMDFTRLLKNECKKYNVSPQEKCFADLMAMGWKDTDAYLMSGLYNMVYSKEANIKDMNRLLVDDVEFKNYWALARKRASRPAKEEEEENIDMQTELSKENQLRELLIAKKKLTVGAADWLKIVQTIADITQAKKDEIQTEDTTIHYYLPLSCNMCELYKKAQKKAGNANMGE